MIRAPGASSNLLGQISNGAATSRHVSSGVALKSSK